MNNLKWLKFPYLFYENRKNEPKSIKNLKEELGFGYANVDFAAGSGNLAIKSIAISTIPEEPINKGVR